MSREMLKWNSAKTVLASDIWFLLALWHESPWPGAHARTSTHNVVFLDGHAEAIQLGDEDVKRTGSRRTYAGANWSVYDNRPLIDPKSSDTPWFTLDTDDPFGGGKGELRKDPLEQ